VPLRQRAAAKKELDYFYIFFNFDAWVANPLAPIPPDRHCASPPNTGFYSGIHLGYYSRCAGMFLNHVEK
jgi:hypothetical protein